PAGGCAGAQFGSLSSSWGINMPALRVSLGWLRPSSALTPMTTGTSARFFIALAGAAFSVLFSSVLNLGASARLTNSPPTNGQVLITWNSRGALETATQISGPWLTITNAPNPYTNSITSGSRFFRLNQTVDATTLRKKVLAGYQGWFRCPGDGASQWIHWSRSSSSIASNT